MRKKLVAANWKENKTVQEAILYAKLLRKGKYICEVLIAPSFVSLEPLSRILKNSKIALSAQDVSQYEGGAYTGEVSASMVSGLCEYSMVGHSERRGIFGDSDETVNAKLMMALKSKLKAILCIGETDIERQKGLTQSVIRRQFISGLKGVPIKDLARIVIAYEPVWAISRGNSNMKAATPEDAEDAHRLIRHLAARSYGKYAASKLRIIYGGSVKPENARDLFSQKDIDGGLVGNASLDVKSFKKILAYIDM
jgi:triosephosphate isomerase